MNGFSQSWSLEKLDFHLVVEDIFTTSVQAIVNSEQTDFILDRNPMSISGQIYQRFGDRVQEELFSKTNFQVLTEGTVLKTGAIGDYQVIYHAGFHLPWKYLYPLESDSPGTEYLKIIRSCIRQILDDFAQSPLSSVAFPLIGTGVFGLDPGLLAYEFIQELLSFAETTPLPTRKEIWLVIRPGIKKQRMTRILDSTVQAMIDRFSTSKFNPLHLGVTFIDDFEHQVVHSNHPKWFAWLLCRYAELIAYFIYCQLAMTLRSPILPHNVLKEGSPAAFGLFRDGAESIVRANNRPPDADEWTQLCYSLIADDFNRRNLEHINQDRNDIAHGRESRSAEQIHASIVEFLQKDRWNQCRVIAGSPLLSNLYPWLTEAPSGESFGKSFGILDKWAKNHWTYLIPASGKSFKIPSPVLTYEPTKP